jgi:hypothetical protein
MVTGAGKILDRPQVKITQQSEGTRLTTEERYDVDLGAIARNRLTVSRLLLNYVDGEH